MGNGPEARATLGVGGEAAYRRGLCEKKADESFINSETEREERCKRLNRSGRFGVEATVAVLSPCVAGGRNSNWKRRASVAYEIARPVGSDPEEQITRKKNLKRRLQRKRNTPRKVTRHAIEGKGGGGGAREE